MKKGMFLLSILTLLTVSLLVPCGSMRAAAKKPKINVKNLEMTLGSEFRLRVYNLNKQHTVAYLSSNPETAAVSSSVATGRTAMITAMSTGSATITATVRKEKKLIRRLRCRITVTPAAVSIKFPKRVIRLNPSERIRLDPIIKPNTSAEQPLFESDNPVVASVSCRGLVTALSPGRATITATLPSSGITTTCIVEVPMYDSTMGSTPPHSANPARNKKSGPVN